MYSHMQHKLAYLSIANKIHSINSSLSCFHIGATAVEMGMVESNYIDVLITYPISQSVGDVLTQLDHVIQSDWEPALLPYVSFFSHFQQDNGRFKCWVYPENHDIVSRFKRFVIYLTKYPKEAIQYNLKKRQYADHPDYHQLKAGWIRSIDQRARHLLSDCTEHQFSSSKELDYGAQIIAMQHTRLTYKSFMPYYMSDMRFVQTSSYIKVKSPYQNASLNYLIHLESGKTTFNRCMRAFNDTFADRSAVWYLAPMAMDFEWYQMLSQQYQQTDQYIGYVYDHAFSAFMGAPEIPADFIMKRVLTAQQIHDYYAVKPVWREFAMSVTGVGLQQQDPIHLYVGYLSGKPVASIALVLTLGVVGLYGLHVCPRYRKQGLGQYLVDWGRYQAAQYGARYVMCQAGSALRGIVVQAGFKPLCQYIEYGHQVQSRMTLPA